MISELKSLSSLEQELIFKAPILVCILIAGADGNIDRKEIRKAIEFAEKKTVKLNSAVSFVFIDIAQDFEDKLKILLQQYPFKSQERNPIIVNELSGLNSIWGKIDSAFASEFYNTLLSISNQIASSSGGIMGYNTVGSEEARYLNLDMISKPASG